MANQPEKQLRDFTLSVRLRTDMRERLEFVAERLGVAPATVATMAIGQYVAAQHAALTASERQGESMGKAVTEALSEIFKNQFPESEIPCLSSSASSAPSPLLVVEPTKKPVKSFPSAKFSRSKRSTNGDSSK
jgi:predicted transcriptional regulator